MSSRIFTAVQAPPSPQPQQRQDTQAPDSSKEPRVDLSLPRERSRRASPDSVAWDEPPVLVALAIAFAMAAAVVVLLTSALI